MPVGAMADADEAAVLARRKAEDSTGKRTFQQERALARAKIAARQAGGLSELIKAARGEVEDEEAAKSRRVDKMEAQKRSIVYLTALAEQSPNNAAVFRKLARAKFRLWQVTSTPGHLSDVQEAYAKALQFRANADRPEMWWDLARVYFSFGALDGGLNVVQRLVVDFPRFKHLSKAMFTAAFAYRRLKQFDASISYFLYLLREPGLLPEPYPESAVATQLAWTYELQAEYLVKQGKQESSAWKHAVQQAREVWGQAYEKLHLETRDLEMKRKAIVSALAKMDEERDAVAHLTVKAADNAYGRRMARKQAEEEKERLESAIAEAMKATAPPDVSGWWRRGQASGATWEGGESWQGWRSKPVVWLQRGQAFSANGDDLMATDCFAEALRLREADGTATDVTAPLVAPWKRRLNRNQKAKAAAAAAAEAEQRKRALDQAARDVESARLAAIKKANERATAWKMLPRDTVWAGGRKVAGRYLLLCATIEKPTVGVPLPGELPKAAETPAPEAATSFVVAGFDVGGVRRTSKVVVRREDVLRETEASASVAGAAHPSRSADGEALEPAPWDRDAADDGGAGADDAWKGAGNERDDSSRRNDIGRRIGQYLDRWLRVSVEAGHITLGVRPRRNLDAMAARMGVEPPSRGVKSPDEQAALERILEKSRSPASMRHVREMHFVDGGGFIEEQRTEEVAPDTPESHRAARQVQRLVRGHSGRLLAGSKRELLHRIEGAASTNIQRTYRGRSARNLLEANRRLKAVKTMQNLARGRSAWSLITRMKRERQTEEERRAAGMTDRESSKLSDAERAEEVELWMAAANAGLRTGNEKLLAVAAEKAIAVMPTDNHVAASDVTVLAQARSDVVAGRMQSRALFILLIQMRLYLRRRRKFYLHTEMAQRIQRKYRAWWWQNFCYLRHRRKFIAASNVQRIFRGNQDRRVAAARREHIIPPLVQIQSVYRQFQAVRRTWYARLLKYVMPAVRIIVAHRSVTRFMKMASKTLQLGKMRAAVLVIQCAWRQYLARRRLDWLRERYDYVTQKLKVRKWNQIGMMSVPIHLVRRYIAPGGSIDAIDATRQRGSGTRRPSDVLLDEMGIDLTQVQRGQEVLDDEALELIGRRQSVADIEALDSDRTSVPDDADVALLEQTAKQVLPPRMAHRPTRMRPRSAPARDPGHRRKQHPVRPRSAAEDPVYDGMPSVMTVTGGKLWGGSRNLVRQLKSMDTYSEIESAGQLGTLKGRDRRRRQILSATRQRSSTLRLTRGDSPLGTSHESRPETAHSASYEPSTILLSTLRSVKDLDYVLEADPAASMAAERTVVGTPGARPLTSQSSVDAGSFSETRGSSTTGRTDDRPATGRRRDSVTSMTFSALASSMPRARRDVRDRYGDAAGEDTLGRTRRTTRRPKTAGARTSLSLRAKKELHYQTERAAHLGFFLDSKSPVASFLAQSRRMSRQQLSARRAEIDDGAYSDSDASTRSGDSYGRSDSDASSTDGGLSAASNSRGPASRGSTDTRPAVTAPELAHPLAPEAQTRASQLGKGAEDASPPAAEGGAMIVKPEAPKPVPTLCRVMRSGIRFLYIKKLRTFSNECTLWARSDPDAWRLMAWRRIDQHLTFAKRRHHKECNPEVCMVLVYLQRLLDMIRKPRIVHVGDYVRAVRTMTERLEPPSSKRPMEGSDVGANQDTMAALERRLDTFRKHLRAKPSEAASVRALYHKLLFERLKVRAWREAAHIIRVMLSEPGMVPSVGTLNTAAEMCAAPLGPGQARRLRQQAPLVAGELPREDSPVGLALRICAWMGEIGGSVDVRLYNHALGAVYASSDWREAVRVYAAIKQARLTPNRETDAYMFRIGMRAPKEERPLVYGAYCEVGVPFDLAFRVASHGIESVLPEHEGISYT